MGLPSQALLVIVGGSLSQLASGRHVSDMKM